MQPAFPTTVPDQVSSLTIESLAYMGQNQMRRPLGKSVHNYQGAAVVDRQIQLQPDEEFTVTENILVFVAVSSGIMDVKVTLEEADGGIVEQRLRMVQYLALDVPQMTGVTFNNKGTVPANVHLSYATTKSETPPT